MPDRYTGLDVAVFSMSGTSGDSGNLIALLENCTIEMDVKDKESKGIGDFDDYPWPVGGKTQITANLMINDANLLRPFVGTSVTCVFNPGPGTYTGQFLVSKFKHDAKREDLQMQNVTLMSQGKVAFS